MSSIYIISRSRRILLIIRNFVLTADALSQTKMLNLRVFTILIVVRLVRSDFDEYLDESQRQCSVKSNLVSCAKYRALKYFSTMGHEYGLLGNGSSNSTVRLVKMDRYYEEPDLFPTARQMPNDNEFTKFFKFAKRQVNYYLGTQGIRVTLPDEAQIIQEDGSNFIGEGRGKKKRAAIVLMPLIILFKLFKIKVMVAMVLASLLFIKKAIMLGALVLPSIIQNLKHCSRMQHYYHPVPHHHEDMHEHEEYGGGYGKDYDRAYNAYSKNKGIRK